MSLNVGDIVRVNNNDAGMTMIYKAEVIHTPRGEGDLWGFKDCTCGTEIYTSERIAVNQHKDGRYAAARILRILCHRLRAADNRDAAGVSDDDFVHPEYIRGFNDGAKTTPAAVPAGEAECSCDELTQEADGSISGLCSVCLAYLRPKPVQAAPQEGEAAELAKQLNERVDSVVVAGATGNESILLAEVNKLLGCARMVAVALSNQAAHYSACELGAVHVIKKCRRALAEEMAAYDIDPPIAHLKEAHDACTAWLDGSALQHRGDSRGGEGVEGG